MANKLGKIKRTAEVYTKDETDAAFVKGPSPSATLEITSSGSLRIFASDGTTLWQQGYKLATESSETITNETFNLFTVAHVPEFDIASPYEIGDTVAYDGEAYTFTAVHQEGAWIGTDAVLAVQSFSLPAVPEGKAGDFVVQVDNSANTVSYKVAIAEFDDGTINMLVPKERDIDAMFTIDGGERCELYFTQTAFGVEDKPTWKVMRIDLDVAQ